MTYQICPFQAKICQNYTNTHQYYFLTNWAKHVYNEVKAVDIHPTVKEKVEKLLLAMGAVKTINRFCTEYCNNDDMEKLKLLSMQLQYINLKRKMFLIFLSFASVNKRMLPFMVHAREKFDCITNLDRLIYIGIVMSYNVMVGMLQSAVLFLYLIQNGCWLIRTRPCASILKDSIPYLMAHLICE